MSEPFVGEIRITPYGFVPEGFAACNGQSLPVSQNTALFAVIGTNFGGDGMTTFKVPDFGGCTPVGTGKGPGLSNYDLGDPGGEETHTLLSEEMPVHNHLVQISGRAALTEKPDGKQFAVATGVGFYGEAGGDATMLAGATLPIAGGGAPHDNMMPFMALQFVIALTGVFPQRHES
jgi:microcystin-dependent protein